MGKRKGRLRDTGLTALSSEELERLLNDKNLPKKARQRYLREAKARGMRNVQKREARGRRG